MTVLSIEQIKHYPTLGSCSPIRALSGDDVDSERNFEHETPPVHGLDEAILTQ